MHAVRINRWGEPTPARTRRPALSWTARSIAGVALAVALSGLGSVQPVAAQDEDDTITLTAGGSTLVVSPGNASAISAVAEAHASPGHAETIGAAARAVADCVDGALAEGAAALAVAHPDEGAAADAALASIEAKSNKELDQPIRRVVENKCKVEEKKEEKKAPPVKKEAPEAPEVEVPEVEVAELPVTGVGTLGSAGLSGLLAAASAAAALGAVGFRNRGAAGAMGLRSDR